MSSPNSLVSVITVCLNAEKTIRQTIESVLKQTYKPIEYIVVDGVSTDSTLKIVDEYRKEIAVVIREKDEGISDAFNKGIRSANGEYIQILNADDMLEKDKIECSINILQKNPQAGYVFGDIIVLDESGKTVLRIIGNNSYATSIHRTMDRMNHPTVFARRKLYDNYGLFDLQWKVAMDYEWMLRVHKNGEHGIYSPDVCVTMRRGGNSDRQRTAAYREVRDISILHGYNNVFARAYYALRLVKNFLLKLIGMRL